MCVCVTAVCNIYLVLSCKRDGAYRSRFHGKSPKYDEDTPSGTPTKEVMGTSTSIISLFSIFKIGGICTVVV